MARVFSRKNVLAAAIGIGLFLSGWFVHAKIPSGTFVPIDPPLRARGDYKLINPLLVCGTWESKDFDEYTSAKKKIADFITIATNAGTAESVGVYFRELKGGRWFGVNENAKFSPASLLKMPIMIAYFKSAEKEAKIMDKSLLYDGSFDLNKDEHFRSPYWIGAGNTYKVGDLITAMVVNSDNNATSLLFNDINRNSLAEVFTDLGLSIPADNTPSVDVISPKSFSYFFRVLYNATYVSSDFSEKALNLLARAEFPPGISAVLPKQVVVASKFGERSVFSPANVLQYRELHDCGIIYAPVRPYVLCIMTKGKDFEDLASIVQQISKLTYDEIRK